MTFLAREGGRQHKAPCGAQRNAGYSGPVRRKPAKAGGSRHPTSGCRPFHGLESIFSARHPALASPRTGLYAVARLRGLKTGSILL